MRTLLKLQLFRAFENNYAISLLKPINYKRRVDTVAPLAVSALIIKPTSCGNLNFYIVVHGHIF